MARSARLTNDEIHVLVKFAIPNSEFFAHRATVITTAGNENILEEIFQYFNYESEIPETWIDVEWQDEISWRSMMVGDQVKIIKCSNGASFTMRCESVGWKSVNDFESARW